MKDLTLLLSPFWGRGRICGVWRGETPPNTTNSGHLYQSLSSYDLTGFRNLSGLKEISLCHFPAQRVTLQRRHHFRSDIEARATLCFQRLRADVRRRDHPRMRHQRG